MCEFISALIWWYSVYALFKVKNACWACICTSRMRSRTDTTIICIQILMQKKICVDGSLGPMRDFEFNIEFSCNSCLQSILIYRVIHYKATLWSARCDLKDFDHTHKNATIEWPFELSRTMYHARSAVTWSGNGPARSLLPSSPVAEELLRQGVHKRRRARADR